MPIPGFDDWLTDQDRWAGSSFNENYHEPCIFLRDNGDGTDRCEFEQLIPYMSPCERCPDSEQKQITT